MASGSLAGNMGNAAVGTLIFAAISSLAESSVFGIILTGALTFGYTLFIMCLADTRTSRFDLLFQGFNRFVETLVAGLLVTLAVTAGTALLIVPGIYLACGFSMTFFLMADNQNMSGIEAMQRSWEMMNGHKWDYFCLMFSYIGWILLSILTCGILMLWVTPKMMAASLYFYRELLSSNQKYTY